MSKTSKAEKTILRAIRNKRGKFRLNEIVAKHRGKLPMTFAIWNLCSRGDLVRTGQRGVFLRG